MMISHRSSCYNQHLKKRRHLVSDIQDRNAETKFRLFLQSYPDEFFIIITVVGDYINIMKTIMISIFIYIKLLNSMDIGYTST